MPTPYQNYLDSKNQTPQTEKAREDQVRNSAGGYVFKVSETTAIDRFLILGSDTPTYYASAQTLTKENAQAVVAYIKRGPEFGQDLVNRIVAVSTGGRAPKNSPALLALALAASVGDEDTQQAAFLALTKVARTATHLFEFVGYLDSMRGWGRAPRRAVAEWYASKTAEQVAYQAVKYRQRNGWTHRDVLRLSHPEATDEAQAAVFDWITKGGKVGGLPKVIQGYEGAKYITSGREAATLIRDFGLPWEALPDSVINTPAVWKALVPTMGMTALMRNLSRVARLENGLGDKDRIEAMMIERLSDPEVVRKGRLHPINILTAMRTYAAGTNAVRNAWGTQQGGGSTWTPNRKVIDALDAAFYASFGQQEATGRRYLVALDVSGSMGVEVKPGLSARDVSAAMAMSLLAVEPRVDVVGFCGDLRPLDLSPRRRLDDNVKTVSNLPFGHTDCSLPARWATEQRKDYDAIVIFTDNETWAGRFGHPFQALETYRKQVGHPVTQIVVGLTATNFTIADPRDPHSLDVVGFDSALPNLIAEFSAR